MAGRRVAILYSDSMFAQGVERLLRQVQGLEVVGVDLERQEATSAVELLKPAAVVLDAEDSAASKGNLVFRILQASPNVHVFCLTTAANSLAVYNKRQVVVSSLAELVKAIQEY